MTSASNVRIMMTWMPSAGLGEIENAENWRATLAQSTLPNAPFCLWSTVRPPHPFAGESVCWHELKLPERIDRYERGTVAKGIWSPWGNKSGPNFQFFMQLEEMRTQHPEEWVLQIEGDTFLVGEDPGAQIERLLAAHPEAWVIGAVNHPKVLEVLDPLLHGHINGAAFYRVGSAEFRDFRRQVWIPTLIELVGKVPSMAYDCASAPEIWDQLSKALHLGWLAGNSKFVRTFGMVNASTIATRVLDDPRLNHDEIREGLASEGALPWFLHTKLVTPRKAKR